LPTGTVNFYDGSTFIGSDSAYGGVAEIMTLSLSTGSNSITAAYQGDRYNGPSTSPAFNQTVNKATPTITWSNPSAITYRTALGGTQLNATANVQGSFAYSPASGTVLGAGSGQTLSTTFTPTDTTDYNTATRNVSITVNQAGLTITASSGSMSYGGTPPTVTPSYSGFVNNDTSGSLSTQPTCATTATNSTPAGTDTGADTCSGAAGANYSISYAAGNVTVGQASLTITASNGSMTYGGTPPTVTPSYSGFVDGQGASSLTTQPTCSTTATSSTPAGTDTGADTCSGAVDANYSISYVAGNVTVGKASVTPSVTAGNKTYDGTTTATITGCTLTGVIGSDQVSCAASSATFAGANVGTGITVTATGITLSGSAAGNYTLTSTTATTSANINMLTPTVTLSPGNGNSNYGSPVTFTATVSAPAPTGTVTFYDASGTITLGGGALSNGQASLTISTLTPGSHSITATYNGDGNDHSNASGASPWTVNWRSMTLPGYCVY
jgi:hypothetical protein